MRSCISVKRLITLRTQSQHCVCFRNDGEGDEQESGSKESSQRGIQKVSRDQTAQGPPRLC